MAQLMGRGERVGRNVHTGGVNGVLLTADGSRAITYAKDCTVRALLPRLFCQALAAPLL